MPKIKHHRGWPIEKIAHADLTDMPDVADVNSDHDARYANKNAADSILGVWNFVAHPTGLDHTQIANIGVNTHAQLDTAIAYHPHQDVTTTASPSFVHGTFIGASGGKVEIFEVVASTEMMIKMWNKTLANYIQLSTVGTGANFDFETNAGNISFLVPAGKHFVVRGDGRSSTNGSYDWGSSTKRWRDILLSRNLSDGTNTLTVANAKAAYDHSQSLNDTHWVAAPAATGSAGTAGQKAYDAGFFYVCTAANTWKRVAIAAW